MFQRYGKGFFLDCVTGIILDSNREYKTDEITSVELDAKKEIDWFSEKYVVAYAWQDGLNGKHFLRLYLLDNRCDEKTKEMFRQRIKSMDYNRGVVIN